MRRYSDEFFFPGGCTKLEPAVARLTHAEGLEQFLLPCASSGPPGHHGMVLYQLKAIVINDLSEEMSHASCSIQTLPRELFDCRRAILKQRHPVPRRVQAAGV